MIAGAGDAGNRYFVPPEKPATSCGNTGPQMRTWSYLGTNRFNATGTGLGEAPGGHVSDLAAGIVPR